VQRRFKSIDVLRAVAACSVVLFHSTPKFPLGAAGVDLFFVVSGFVIAHVTAERPNRHFLLDRAARILPLYWLALLPWVWVAFSAGSLTIGSLLSNLLLVPMWFGQVEPLLLLSWTLAFEILFYTAAAIALRSGSATPVIAGYFAFLLAWALTGSIHFKWFGNPVVLEFLAGVAIFHARRKTRAALPALIVGAGLLLLSPPISIDVSEFSSALARVFYWGLPAAMIVYGITALETELHGAWIDRLCGLGIASYSIYLFHPIATALIHDPWWAKAIFGIVAGLAGWLMFERNFERFRRRWRKRRQEQRPALSTTA
jgi:exopolysaccharide production protein ExoZ